MSSHSESFKTGTHLAIRTADGWIVGVSTGPSAGDKVEIRLSTGEIRTVDAGSVKTAADVYLDSRGAEMPPMRYSEALAKVFDLAAQQHPAENDDPGNETLGKLLKWQEAALVTANNFIAGFGDLIDESLDLPVAFTASPDSEVGCHPALDPSNPVEALRICLELGENGIHGPSGADAGEADEIDRANQACDLVRDLIGMHQQEIATYLLSPPSP